MKEEVNIDFENSLGPLLGKTVKLIEYHLLGLFIEAGLDMTKEQMIILKRLSEKDGLSQNDLAYMVFRNKSSLTRLLTKMERKGYIERKQGEADKRVKRVYITPQGKNAFALAKPIIKKIIIRSEQNISDEEKDQFINTLKHIQNNFKTTIDNTST